MVEEFFLIHRHSTGIEYKTYLSLLPGLESKFVLFELVAPVGVDLLVVRCLVRRTASVITENINISIQFRNFEREKPTPSPNATEPAITEFHVLFMPYP